jgi:hypothetical protein
LYAAVIVITADFITGMFFEVPTIWKEKISHREPAEAPDPPKWIPALLKRSSSTGIGKVSMNRTLPDWRPRRVGVFISKNHDPDQVSNNIVGAAAAIDENAWTCLVLVEPLEKTQNDFVFCYRKIERSADYPTPNARTVDGRRHYSVQESDLQGFITYLVDDLLEHHLSGKHKGKSIEETYEE